MLELTKTSPYLDSEVQLSSKRMTKTDECFPNYSKLEQPIGKGPFSREYEGEGREGVGADFTS